MKNIFMIVVFIVFFTGIITAQKLLVNGVIGIPLGDYSFSSNSKIENLAYGGSLGVEFDISKNISGYVTAGISFLGQNKVSAISSNIPLMVGLKYNMGTFGFLPYIGAEVGYTFIKYNDYLGAELTLKDPAISALLGLSVPLTRKIVWDIHSKYNLVLNTFRSNSLISINTGFAFSLN